MNNLHREKQDKFSQKDIEIKRLNDRIESLLAQLRFSAQVGNKERMDVVNEIIQECAFKHQHMGDTILVCDLKRYAKKFECDKIEAHSKKGVSVMGGSGKPSKPPAEQDQLPPKDE